MMIGARREARLLVGQSNHVCASTGSERPPLGCELILSVQSSVRDSHDITRGTRPPPRHGLSFPVHEHNDTLGADAF